MSSYIWNPENNDIYSDKIRTILSLYDKIKQHDIVKFVKNNSCVILLKLHLKMPMSFKLKSISNIPNKCILYISVNNQ